MKDEPNVASKLQPPAQAETFLFASVMAVAWACVTTAGWAVLAVAFGRTVHAVRDLESARPPGLEPAPDFDARARSHAFHRTARVQRF